MNYAAFRTKKNGVPILSKLEIDNIAEFCLREFCPDSLMTPQAIDGDRFLTEYLKLTQDFQFLTHCGAYLGMMVFDDSNKIVVYNPNTDRAEYITAKRGTVILDNTLLKEGQEHRYRFTAIHEGGHWLLHRNKFCRALGQVSSFDTQKGANVKCRAASIYGKVKPLGEWDDDMYNSISVSEVAKVFNVSYRAAEFRLINLNLISKMKPEELVFLTENK